MEPDDNLMLTESYPPAIKKPSTLPTSPSTRMTTETSTLTSSSQAWNDEAIKPRKPRLFRQPKALVETSPHQSSSSSTSSLGDNPNPFPTSSTSSVSTVNDSTNPSSSSSNSSNITTIFRPVPQVSVTLSSPDNPFDDSTIEYIDSDVEVSPSNPVDKLTTTSNDHVKVDVNSKTTQNDSIESNHSNSNARTNEQNLVETLTDTRKTKYLTRTLALLKLQYLRKSRSEDTGDPETRNMRRLSERPSIGDPGGLMSHVHPGVHHSHNHPSQRHGHHHTSTHHSHLLGPVNKSLSSASLCGNSLATSPPTSLLRTSNSGGSAGSGSAPVELEPYILGIHIHNTDRKLKSSRSVVHPVVKIHIIDSETSSYLVKKHPDRDVAFYYETGNSKNNFILPVMTQNCDMLTRIRYPRYPIWEELLLYNEDYSYFLADNVVIFFEILDFLTFSGPSDKRYNSMKRNEWWYRIAWAFLSLKSSDGSFNTGKKLRLQLYKPISQKVTIDPKNPHTTELFDWWKEQKLIPFQGSIYVTVSPVPLIVSRETFSPSLRSYGPFQPEIKPEVDHHHHHHHHQGSGPPRRPSSAISNSTIERSPSTTSNSATNQQSTVISKSLDAPLESRLSTGSGSSAARKNISSDGEPSVIWSRIEGAPCKIPKNLWHQFSAGNNKCSYAIKFSWDGRKVACGASVFTAYRSNEKRSSIFIYEIPSGKFVKRVNGFHSGAIYEIDWSPNDKYLVSASSDCTAHVWNNVKEYQSSILLPHPCFVYTARFHVTRSGIVFTGSYDGLIRVWCIKLSLESTAVEPQLVQEIDCFYGQVLSLAWKISFPTTSSSITTSTANTDPTVDSSPTTKSVVTLFASGSKGEIITLSQRDVTSDFTWYLSGSIKINEIIEIPINNIVIHPHANKILIFSRDGVQRMIDYQLEIIVQRFTGSLNFHHLIRGCLSPCGKFVYAGGEDSLVHCWNADTGEKLFTYNELPFKGPISCIEHHPFDNIIAICGLNARTISVCLFNNEMPKLVGSPVILKNTITPSSSQSSSAVVNTSKQNQSQTHDGKSKSNNRFELIRSKTIDQSNCVSESGAIRRGNFKVQRAMRRLEFALRTKSIDKR